MENRFENSCASMAQFHRKKSGKSSDDLFPLFFDIKLLFFNLFFSQYYLPFFQTKTIERYKLQEEPENSSRII